MKLSHTDFKNIAIGRTESGAFIILREALGTKSPNRFYVCKNSSPINKEYLLLDFARILFAKQFNIN